MTVITIIVTVYWSLLLAKHEWVSTFSNRCWNLPRWIETLDHLHSQNIFYCFTSAIGSCTEENSLPFLVITLTGNHPFFSSWTTFTPGMSFSSYMMFWAPWSSGKLLVNNSSCTLHWFTCYINFILSQSKSVVCSWFSPSSALTTSSVCSLWPLLSGLSLEVACGMDCPLQVD